MSSDEQPGLILSEDEWDATFRDPADALSERRLPRWARVLAWLAAVAMVASSLTVVVNVVRSIRQTSEPAEIVAAGWAYVDQSDWGWLVSDVVVRAIEEPSVGAFVRNNPADGVIHVDLRGWWPDRLDRLMAHEIGHLIDFAAYPSGHANPRGGLEVEVWAECAAVDAGERSLDDADFDERYRCASADLATYQAEVASFGEICVNYAGGRCRSTHRG